MKNLFIMLISVFLISGCATIVDTAKGKTQQIYFTTPTGKSVVAVIDGQKVTIPAVVEVKKSGEIDVNIFTSDNPQYLNYSARLSSLNAKETAPAWWLNIMGSFFSTSGSTTDKVAGSSYQYSQPVVIIPVNEK